MEHPEKKKNDDDIQLLTLDTPQLYHLIKQQIDKTDWPRIVSV
jgi:uncharacterized protein YlaN (UPF0358 family)